MLKDADASRRAIERDFTPDKANEYNKIMAIRNTAFINLIKEDVPYVENEEKESVRIEIDGEGYDMKKSKLKLLVGDEVYERILARSHEHAQTLSNLKDNEADIPEYQTPRIGQTMPQQPASGQYQQPYGCGQQGMQQMPYAAADAKSISAVWIWKLRSADAIRIYAATDANAAADTTTGQQSDIWGNRRTYK